MRNGRPAYKETGLLFKHDSISNGEIHVDAYMSLISDVGFPVIVTLYLLHRIEAKLDGVIESIQRLSEQLAADWRAE